MTQTNKVKQKCWVVKEHPGIIRFSDGDNLTGILAGMRAPMIANAVNSHDLLVEALYTALPFVEDALLDTGYKTGLVRKVINEIKAALKATGVEL